MDTLAKAEPAAPLHMLASLRQRLNAALGPDIGVACADVNGDPEQLWPVEQAAIRNAVSRRRREFAAGRAAAREAMRDAGLESAAVGVASDRSPIWPAGVVGSIAHNTRACVAIVGRRDRVHAMGIDIEADRPMERALWSLICTQDELAKLACEPPSEQGHWATRLFCAKEAFYKWQYPLTGRMLDFGDVQVTFSRDRQSYHIQSAIPELPVLLPAREGRFLTLDGMTLAWLVGPAHPGGGLRSGSVLSKHEDSHQ